MANKKYLDYEGLKELVEKIKDYVAKYGPLTFKGVVADVASLPSLSSQGPGWMYTVTAAGKTTADFTDGAGKTIAANSEVAAVEIGGSATSVWSLDGGTSYVSADLQAYTPTGTISAGTKLGSAYVADGTETHLVNGALYATADGTTFYTVTGLADTFAGFTKSEVTDSDALSELATLYSGSSFKDLNLYTEAGSGVMKWVLIGPVFDVSDRLQFGNAFPADPEDEQTFLYMGETTYAYNEVTPEGTEDPAALGWYHSSDGGTTWTLATEHTPDTSTYIYATYDEKYVKGVIYVYDETEAEWIPQSAGDTMIPITDSEIDALFE